MGAGDSGGCALVVVAACLTYCPPFSIFVWMLSGLRAAGTLWGCIKPVTSTLRVLRLPAALEGLSLRLVPRPVLPRWQESLFRVFEAETWEVCEAVDPEGSCGPFGVFSKAFLN